MKDLGAIDILNHDSVSVNGGTGDDSITVNGDPNNPNANLNFSGGEGEDTFSINSSNSNYTIMQGDQVYQQGAEGAPVVNLDGFETVRVMGEDGKWKTLNPIKKSEGGTDVPATDTTNNKGGGKSNDPYQQFNPDYLKVCDIGDKSQRDAAFQEWLGSIPEEHRATYQKAYDMSDFVGKPVENGGNNNGGIPPSDESANSGGSSDSDGGSPPSDQVQRFQQILEIPEQRMRDFEAGIFLAEVNDQSHKQFFEQQLQGVA